ncbi:YfiR family protein [Flavobacterium frigoris]|uniref:Transmembrane protein n=1 Tax=Flavobacterium frigoris TaxID=229204 RepID=A0A1H9C5D1_FLAFI|nr:YfiR family protein [Flavobacterium frigoris]SEP96191.1 protein of unknown function [Flavobacterium frigoris]
MALKSKLLLFGIMLILLGTNPLAAQQLTGGKDYDLKADFLIRFVDYVYWKNYPKNKPFKIAILEESPINASLHVVKNRKKIEVSQYKNLKDIGFCNILFVPFDCSIPIETVLSNFSGKPVLIVTERNGYGKKGAHMNFVVVENKLKFEVNLKAINKVGIGISSFLLQHAIIVE